LKLLIKAGESEVDDFGKKAGASLFLKTKFHPAIFDLRTFY
jgi:hypothetical protein